MAYPIGRSGFHLGAAMNTREKHLRVELYIQGERPDECLQGLEAQRGQIERDLGYPLEWGRPVAHGPATCRIACYLRDADPEDESDWQRQHEWLATRLNELYGAFADRVRSL